MGYSCEFKALNEVIRPVASDLSILRRILHHMADMTGEVREKPKESKENNKKTPRLMGFIQNDDREWVKKGVVTPQKGSAWDSDFEKESDDEEEATTERTPTGTRM
ncbi:hypothetical protein CJ030_MR5G019242 [Morella rubra]|uniref:Uncharacterized protein n=1 Tax=Morella rubra TaxID=262757 RepID=A0A6A1VJN3_9ROSI|nr:hypothetical protein CJ030_MR5G019242 [Morella rubra]